LIGDIVVFVFLWFLVSIPIGLLLGRFFAYQSTLREMEFTSYIDKLRRSQMTPNKLARFSADDFNMVHPFASPKNITDIRTHDD
jgi:hypothetical protein